jgi:hypothetical protein
LRRLKTLKKDKGELFMNLLTRSVLEDLIKMDVALSKAMLDTHKELDSVLDKILHGHLPADIIMKIMGLNSDDHGISVGEILIDVYEGKITITEAIDELEKERELSVV